MERRSAIIVGAGPAGLLTALYLKRLRPELAARLLVLERKKHPRKKLCGGGVNAKAFPVLESVGVDLKREGPRRFVAQGYDIRFREKRYVVEQPGGTLIFDRAALDAYLCEKARAAGIEIHEEEAVEEIDLSRRGVRVVTSKGTYEAECVVGADGVGSLVRRAAGIEDAFPRARLVQVERPLEDWDPRWLVFDFTCLDWGIAGYAWLFPEPDPACAEGLVAKIGIYDRTPEVKERVNPRPVAVRRASSWGYAVAEKDFDSYSIREWTPRSRFSAPRVLLVGDAAGADPLVAEGLHQAFAYGEQAALALSRAHERSDFGFRGYTRQINESPLGAELSRNRLAANFLYSPIYEYGLRFGFKYPSILEKVFAYVAGKRPDYAALTPGGVVRKALWHAVRKPMGLA